MSSDEIQSQNTQGSLYPLVVEGLRKSFRNPAGEKLDVLRGASFRVEPSEMVAIMGASGAGKSTLLHLLGGLELADSGSVKFGGFEVTHASGDRLARFRNKQVGFVFQFHHLLPDLTATENVAFPLFISRIDLRPGHRRAVEALQSLGLGDRFKHRIGDLSGGEQQRVALARAIINGPALVLADEPTGNLDAPAAEEIGALLSSYCRQRHAVVLVATHNEQIAGRCDRTLVLENGVLRDLVSGTAGPAA